MVNEQELRQAREKRRIYDLNEMTVYRYGWEDAEAALATSEPQPIPLLDTRPAGCYWCGASAPYREHYKLLFCSRHFAWLRDYLNSIKHGEPRQDAFKALADAAGRAAIGAQLSNEQIAIIKLHAVAKHLNISDPPKPDSLLTAVALVEQAAEWARLHIERRGKESDELREQLAAPAPAQLSQEQAREKARNILADSPTESELRGPRDFMVERIANALLRSQSAGTKE